MASGIVERGDGVVEGRGRWIGGDDIDLGGLEANAQFERGRDGGGVGMIPWRHAAVWTGPRLEQIILVGVRCQPGDFGLSGLVAAGLRGAGDAAYPQIQSLPIRNNTTRISRTKPKPPLG